MRHVIRWAISIALLIGVARGSTAALVALLALMVLAHEGHALIERRRR